MLSLYLENLIDSKIEGQLIEFIIDFGNQSINWLMIFESIKNQLRTLFVLNFSLKYDRNKSFLKCYHDWTKLQFKKYDRNKSLRLHNFD